MNTAEVLQAGRSHLCEVAGVSATRPRNSYLRTDPRVGVKELERWPNNWWQVSHLSGDTMLTIMFILVVGGGLLGFGVFVTVLICGIWGRFETDPSFPHSKVERGLHSSIDER
jgi:hypothetical protein